MAAETTFRESKVSTSTNVQTLNMIFQVTAVHTIAIGIELQLCVWARTTWGLYGKLVPRTDQVSGASC